MTAPWCNTCNHFKRKRMAKKSLELEKMADIKFICAEKYQSIVGKQGMVPKWKFFALGEEKREEPGKDRIMYYTHRMRHTIV